MTGLSDPVALGLIVGLPLIIGALNTFFSARANERGKRNEEHLIKLNAQTDGMSENLLKLTGESEHAKGRMEGMGTVIPGPPGPPGEQGLQGKEGPQGKEGKVTF